MSASRGVADLMNGAMAETLERSSKGSPNHLGIPQPSDEFSQLMPQGNYEAGLINR